MEKTKEVFFNKKQRIIRVITVFLAVILANFIIYLSLIITDSQKLYNTIINNASSNSIIEYSPKFKYLYISKKAQDTLNKCNSQLILNNIDFSLHINNDFYGMLSLPSVCKTNLTIDKSNYAGIKVKFNDNKPFEKIKINNNFLGSIFSNSNALDVYTKSNGNLTKHSTIPQGNEIIIDAFNCYIVYIPAIDIEIPENITVYRGKDVDINYTIKPANSTNSTLTFSNYDSAILNIENETFTGTSKGTTTVTCSVDNIEKKIIVTVLPTVEKINLNKTSTEIKLGNWSYVIPTINPSDSVNSKLVWTSSNNNVATVENGMIKSTGIGSCIVTVSTKEEPIVSSTINVKVTPKSTDYRYIQGQFDYPDTIIEGPYYVDNILIVNKKYSLPENFANGLNSEALEALKQMQQAASKQGISLPNISDFRSYNTQKALYERYVWEYGLNYANTYSARPGHSEHSTGLAFDIGNISIAYNLTSAGKWLSENCYKYGFIIRYMKEKENITGYSYEPWHIRYVGKDNAQKIYKSGLCLEEYLKLDK